MSSKFSQRQATLEATTYAFAIRTALRRCGIFLRARGGDRAVGIILPRDANVSAYEDAAKAVLGGSAALDHYSVATVYRGRSPGETYAEKAQTILAGNLGVVVLIEHDAEPPPEVTVALDQIVDMGPVLASHLMSAARSLWQTEITRNEAQQLCRFPAKLLFGALRKGRPVAKVLEALGSAWKPPTSSAWEPRVEELQGFGKARDWALDLVIDLEEWKAGQIAWSDVASGLLLSGPSGTGKTMFAHAVARSCGAKFFSTSSAQWQSKGHLGDMLGAMRRSFRDAAKEAPSVLFIDEIDAIGDRRQFSGSNANYCVQVVNALLELLDGSSAREGVVVVAATNLPGDVDPALCRPGRLDRHIAIDLPDCDARVQMLTLHLKNTLPGENLRRIAEATSGYSGAELAQVARDALRIARRQGRNVQVSDLIDLVPPPIPLLGEERRAVCVHEAGHAVVGIELGVADIGMIVVAREASHRSMTGGHVVWQRLSRHLRARQSYHDEIAMLLGGMAAERIVLGDVQDGSGGRKGSDLHRASNLATIMLSNLGLGSLHYCDVSTSQQLDELRRSDAVLRRRVERLLAGELERACEIVNRRRPEFDRIVAALSEREVIAGDELREILADEVG